MSVLDGEEGDRLLLVARCAGRRVLSVVERDGQTLMRGRGAAVLVRREWEGFQPVVVASPIWGGPVGVIKSVPCAQHSRHEIDPVRLSDALDGGSDGKIVNVDIWRVAVEK